MGVLAATLAAAIVAASVPDGSTLYAERCSSCHGMQGQGSTQGPPLIGAGAAAFDFEIRSGRMPAADPGVQSMPRAPLLTAGEIDALVSFLGKRFPGGPAIPQLARSARVDLPRGREIYEANCEACHGVAGQGGSVGFGWVAPFIAADGSQRIAEAVRVGPGAMPTFGAREIGDADLSSLAAYVASFRAADRGGLALGHAGTVAEGLVAWLIGIGVLLVAVKVIATQGRA